MESRGGLARDERGKPVRLTGSQTDITVRRTIDFDTSLPNLNWVEEELRAARTQALPAALLVLELDGFAGPAGPEQRAFCYGKPGAIRAQVVDRVVTGPAE